MERSRSFTGSHPTPGPMLGTKNAKPSRKPSKTLCITEEDTNEWSESLPDSHPSGNHLDLPPQLGAPGRGHRILDFDLQTQWDDRSVGCRPGHSSTRRNSPDARRGQVHGPSKAGH